MKRWMFLLAFTVVLVGFYAEKAHACGLPASVSGTYYNYCVDYYGGPDSIQTISVTSVEDGTITASGGTAPAFLLSAPLVTGLFDVAPASLGIEAQWSGVVQTSSDRAAEPPVGSWAIGSSHCVGSWSVGTGYYKQLLPTCSGNLYLLHNSRAGNNEFYIGN